MIDLKNSLEIIIALCGLVAIVYRISSVEAAIYREIDKVHDSILVQINNILMDSATYKADYAVRKEWQDYVARDLKSMIKHKFSRLNFHIIDIQRYLQQSSGFVIRSQPVADPDDEED